MAPEDVGFSDFDTVRQKYCYNMFTNHLSIIGDKNMNVVVLYLPGEEEEVSAELLPVLEQAASWGLGLIRAGPKEQKHFPQHLAERSLWVRSGMQEALRMLNDYINVSGMACYIVHDPDGNGAEVLAPRDAPVQQILRRVLAEMNWDIRPAPDGENFGLVLDTMVASTGMHTTILMEHDQVPKNFFATSRDEVPTAKIRLFGARYPRCNGRWQSRMDAVQSLLKDLVTAFSSEEYQARLAAVGDQIDVRDLVKEVHLTVLPRHGFHLTRDMPFKETFQTQTRMQSFINSAINNSKMSENSGGQEPSQDGDIGSIARYSLVVSGVVKMAALPARRKGRTKAQTTAPLVLKAFSVETAVAALPPGSKPFRHSDPKSTLVYGSWLGQRRVPAAFLEAPSEELAYYLRDDPDGPFSTVFSMRMQESSTAEYEVTVQDMEHWHRWGFEVDEHERIMKADWHTLPGVGDQAQLFIPRLGKPGAMSRAPPRCMAFAEAFRMANLRCWSVLVQALQDLQVKREMEHNYAWTMRGSRLVGSLIRCLTERGQFGVMEAQVWWGNRLLTLPSHKDGATSLLHLGVTLSGKRTVRVGAYSAGGMRGNPAALQGHVPEDEDLPEEKENVWDDTVWQKLEVKSGGGRKDFHQQLGSIYLSAPYAFEHGVRFEPSTKQEPIMSLQCRFAFEPGLGKEMNRLRDNVMWDISSTITEVLRRMSASGHLRMPSIEEVYQAEMDLGLTENR